MLTLGSEVFASGRAKYLDQATDAPEPTAKIFVKVNLLGIPVLAQFDTGAAYSMLDREVAEVLGLLDGEGESTTIHTRLGPVTGRLERVPVLLEADEGISLDIEATFLVSRDWSGKTFLGYTGLLDRIRVALDPPVNFFYFGEVA